MSPEDKEKKERLARHYLDEYGDAMLRFAYSYLHNMQDAEDAIQEALIKAVSSEAVFETPAHEKSYLFEIVKNKCFDRLKMNKRLAEQPLDEAYTDSCPETETKDYSFVTEAVGRLPVHAREVIHLFYVEGFSTAEIAKITGRKEATVRSDLRRGRKKLKIILKEEYDFE